MDFEIVFLEKIEKILDKYYPGIKLTRTFDIYQDRFIPYDYESNFLIKQRKKVFVELKTVKTPIWHFKDEMEGIDLLTIQEGKCLKSLNKYNPHFDCYLFIVYMPHNEIIYTKIDKNTKMMIRLNQHLGKQMYWLPKEQFHYKKFN